MKLAFSTLGCPDWTFDEVLDRAEAMGYQAIELRGVNGKMRADEMDVFFPENRAETMKKVAGHGLVIRSFGTSASFHDPEKLESALDDARSAIDLCAEIGVPYVRVFGNNVDNADTVEGEVKRVAGGIRMLCDYAAGKPVDILLEVHGDFNSAARILKTYELVGRENLFILWDVAHSDAADRGDFLSFWEPVKHLIRHVHIKDHKRAAEGRPQLCSVGEGDIPLREIILQLEKDGYEGYYSLEWEKKWHPELREAEEEFPAYVQFMKGIRE